MDNNRCTKELIYKDTTMTIDTVYLRDTEGRHGLPCKTLWIDFA